MSETMTTTKRIIRKAATAAVITMAVSSPAAEAKKPNKVIAKASAATAYRPFVPASVEQCANSAATGMDVRIVAKDRTPKSPIVTLEARNPGEECDDIGTQANESASFTTRVTLYEKLGKRNWMPLGRVVLKNAPLFPLAEGDRDVHATGKMRLNEAMCEDSDTTYKLETATTTLVQDGFPLGITPILPTRLHREAPVLNEVDTIGAPVEGEINLDNIRYAEEQFNC